MTPAQQQREIARQAREMVAAQKAAERERKEEKVRQAAAQKEAERQRRAQERQVEQAIRPAAGPDLKDRPGHHPRDLRDAVQPLTARSASASLPASAQELLQQP